MASRFFRSIRVWSVSLLMCSPQAHSHEYWLDPIDSSINIGDKIVVDIRNGQDYAGASFPFDSARHRSVRIKNNNISTRYEGRLGDYPAIHYVPTEAGLHSVILDTTESYLTYESWNKFTEFLDYHDLVGIAEQHLARKLPQSDIKERYFRSAKTFFKVNSRAENSNQLTESFDVLAPSGSMFEISPLQNPYADNSKLQVQLLFNGAPLSSRQVEMFWKGSHSLRLTTQTDTDGIATFNLLGDGDYMLNAVHVERSDEQGLHWVSYWASMTFER